MSIESEEDLQAAPQPNNTNNNNCEDSDNNAVSSSEDEATLKPNYYCNKNNKNITEGEKINLNKNVDTSTNTATTQPGIKRRNRGTAAASNNQSGEVIVVEEEEEEEEEQQLSPDSEVPPSPTEDSMTLNEQQDSPMDIMAELQEDIIFEPGSPLIPNEILSKLKAQVRTLKRSDLENLIMDKIIEAIATHSDVGVLSQKLTQSNLQRDRLFYKMSNLQRQVAELQQAVRSVSENVGRVQGTRQPANTPIRFYRSVGVQVVLEGALSSVRNLQQTQTRGDSPNSILKSANNTGKTIIPVNNNLGARVNGTIIKARPYATLKPLSPATASALVFGGSINPGLKRVMNLPALTLSERSEQVESQVQGQTKFRRMGSDNGMTTTVMSNGVNGVTAAKGSAPVKSSATTAPNQVRQPVAVHHQIRNPAAAAAKKALNTVALNNGNTEIEDGVVDLTDDDDLPMTNKAEGTVLSAANTSLIVNGSTASNVVLQAQGAQQFRFISPDQPLQFIQNGKNYYQLVTSAGAPSKRSGLMSTPKIQQPRQIRPAPGAEPNQSLLASGAQMSSAQSTAMDPNNPGQLVLYRLPATGCPPLNALAPTMVSKQQQQMNLSASRPGITTMTAAPQPTVAKQAYANGTGKGYCLMTPQQVRGGGGPTLTQVLTRTSIGSPRKKFLLPPLPPPAITGNPGRCSKNIPPRPELTLMEQSGGIVLSWMLKLGSDHSEIQTYQIYACQEPLSNNHIKTAAWTRVGDVKALPLPMRCTLSQFTGENRYHFIVRGVDVYNRTGPFCEASAITLKKKT